MSEERMIPPADANKTLEESITKIKTHSEKLGKLADYVNDFRINQQSGRRH